MSYLTDNLLPNEKLMHETRLHGIVFVKPLVVLLLGLAIMAASRPYDDWLVWPGLVLAATGLGFLIPALFQWQTTELGVTDQRVMAKTGLIQRRSLEMVLHGVESIGVDQDILGRIVNYGTVIISGTGGTQERFTRIADPLDFRRAVNEQIGHEGRNDAR